MTGSHVRTGVIRAYDNGTVPFRSGPFRKIMTAYCGASFAVSIFILCASRDQRAFKWEYASLSNGVTNLAKAFLL